MVLIHNPHNESVSAEIHSRNTDHRSGYATENSKTPSTGRQRLMLPVGTFLFKADTKLAGYQFTPSREDLNEIRLQGYTWPNTRVQRTEHYYQL